MSSRITQLPALLLACCTLAACGGEDAAQPTAAGDSRLTELAEGVHRSDDNVARNQYRNPVATLEFFGLKPDSHVAEIWPGGGWYTEVIAPYVNDAGQYYAAHWDPDSETEFVARGVERFKTKLAEYPELYGNTKMTVLMPPDSWDLGPEGTLDMVLTFRNIHNWMPRGYTGEMFTAAYRALKPGGVLGVVEHRGNEEIDQDPRAASGYVNQAFAIQLAEAAGFELDASSEINANSKDTKDYDTGVWTLPPTLRKKDVDREKYLAIGESDRFTLRFRKPT